MKDSKIEWCHDTRNLWHGCVEVHEGCDNCYARVLNHRWGQDNWGRDNPRKAIDSVWNGFIQSQQLAKQNGEIRRVFVGSMMDIFEKPMPVIDSKGNLRPYDTGYIRDEFFNNIVPSCPNLLFLLLTKRPSNINKYIPESWKVTPPENVMFGTSPVNQETANKLIPQLLQVKGKRFLSCEPMLGEINLMPWLMSEGWVPTYNNPDNSNFDKPSEPTDEFIQWVIVDGESGAKKRPFDPEWARLIQKECQLACVPFFMKQWDKVKEIPADLLIRQFPN